MSVANFGMSKDISSPGCKVDYSIDAVEVYTDLAKSIYKEMATSIYLVTSNMAQVHRACLPRCPIGQAKERCQVIFGLQPFLIFVLITIPEAIMAAS